MLLVIGNLLYYLWSKKSKEAASSEIYQFVSSYRQPDTAWPNPKLSIPTEDITAFSKLLELKGYTLPYNLVAKSVTDELNQPTIYTLS